MNGSSPKKNEKILLPHTKKNVMVAYVIASKQFLLCDDGYSYSELHVYCCLMTKRFVAIINDYKSIQKIMPKNGGSQSYLNQAETF